MALIKGGLLGTSQKRIGNIVTYVVNGRTLARSKAATYNDAKSPAQLLQRSRQTVLVALARLLLGILRTSFQSKKAFQSGYNAFMATNMKPENFQGSTSKLLYANLKVSKGTLLPATPYTVSFNPSMQEFAIQWHDNSNGVTGFGTDRAFIAIASETTKDAITFNTAAIREDGQAKVTVPADWLFDGNICYLYLFFKSQASDSVINVSDSEVIPYLIEI